MHERKRILDIRTFLSQDVFVAIKVDGDDADIALLIRLKNFKHPGLQLSYFENRIEHGTCGLFYRVKYKHGNYFIQWNGSEIIFTRSELQRLHIHF